MAIGGISKKGFYSEKIISHECFFLISCSGIRKTRTFENQNHVKFSSSVYKLSKCRPLNVATRYSLKEKGTTNLFYP